jgi:soluble P-type ATPase
VLELDIPGFKDLKLAHLVLDYNGTLACDGRPLEGVRERLATLAAGLDILILTADTFGTVRSQVADWPCRVEIIPRGREAEAKLACVRDLGADQVVAIGNGRNDRLMLKEAALGIIVIQTEGTAVEALLAADLAVPGILEALDLLLVPGRLKATLRSYAQPKPSPRLNPQQKKRLAGINTSRGLLPPTRPSPNSWIR